MLLASLSLLLKRKAGHQSINQPIVHILIEPGTSYKLDLITICNVIKIDGYKTPLNVLIGRGGKQTKSSALNFTPGLKKIISLSNYMKLHSFA